MLDFNTLSIEEVFTLNKERAEQTEKQTNGMVIETASLNPLINDLKYNHRYFRLGTKMVSKTNGNDVTIHLEEKADNIYLSLLKVKTAKQGTGTKTMKLLSELADKYNQKLTLAITSEFGVSKEVLKDFYERFGFVLDKNSDQFFTRIPNSK